MKVTGPTVQLPFSLASRRPVARSGSSACAVNVVLAQFGLVLADWQGAKYQLSSRTGRTEVVDNFAQVWQAAERILGRACDPLDLSLVARMGQIEQMD